MDERVPDISAGSNTPPQCLRGFLVKRWVVGRRGGRGEGGGGRSSRISGTSSSTSSSSGTTTTTSSSDSNRCSSSRRLPIHLRFHEPLEIKAKMPVVFNRHQYGQAVIKHPRFSKEREGGGLYSIPHSDEKGLGEVAVREEGIDPLEGKGEVGQHGGP
jgi:hypothetical protein